MSTVPKLIIQQASAENLLLVLSGSWRLGEALPLLADLQRRVEATPTIRALAFDTKQLVG